MSDIHPMLQHSLPGSGLAVRLIRYVFATYEARHIRRGALLTSGSVTVGTAHHQENR
jgi:hypothetical protein